MLFHAVLFGIKIAVLSHKCSPLHDAPRTKMAELPVKKLRGRSGYCRASHTEHRVFFEKSSIPGFTKHSFLR